MLENCVLLEMLLRVTLRQGDVLDIEVVQDSFP